MSVLGSLHSGIVVVVVEYEVKVVEKNLEKVVGCSVENEGKDGWA